MANPILSAATYRVEPMSARTAVTSCRCSRFSRCRPSGVVALAKLGVEVLFGARWAVGGDFRRILVVGKIGDEREPAPGAV
jgi:hypothetical protein